MMTEASPVSAERVWVILAMLVLAFAIAGLLGVAIVGAGVLAYAVLGREA